MRNSLFVAFVLFFLVSVQTYAAQRDIVVIESEYDGQTLQRNFAEGVNRALIVGIDEYENHPDLETAVNDAEAVAAVLIDIDDRYFREKYAKPSRNIMTSGGKEPVADGGKNGHSIFAYYFLQFLEQNRYPLRQRQAGRGLRGGNGDQKLQTVPDQPLHPRRGRRKGAVLLHQQGV